MNDKHTPVWERRGEYGLEIWEYQEPEPEVEGDEDAGDDGSGWLSVCTVHQPGEANACLIVQAPARLAALEAIAKMHVDDDTDHAQLSALCIAIARVASKKARGS